MQWWPCFNLANGTHDSGVVAVVTQSFQLRKAQAVTVTTGNRWRPPGKARGKGEKLLRSNVRHHVSVSIFGVGSMVFGQENSKPSEWEGN